jgi:hypothetical protein
MSTLPSSEARKACKICIAIKGLKGSEIDKLPKTDEELWGHIEREHHIPVQRPDETKDQTKARFYATYPEARDPKTCKCPECAERRAREKVERN